MRASKHMLTRFRKYATDCSRVEEGAKGVSKWRTSFLLRLKPGRVAHDLDTKSSRYHQNRRCSAHGECCGARGAGAGYSGLAGKRTRKDGNRAVAGVWPVAYCSQEGLFQAGGAREC